MLKLNTTAPASEPFWLEILPAQGDVPAQRTQFKPVTPAMRLVARDESSRAVLKALPSAQPGDIVPASMDGSLAMASGEVAFVVAMAKLGIVAWDGVGDGDGNEIAPTPEAIAAYMSDWRVYDAVSRLYVQPAMTGAAEKNASAPSRNGTSGAVVEKPIATDAGSSTENPAKSAPTK